MMRRIALQLKALAADWQLARYLARRATQHHDQWLIERRSDGSLWAAGSPQNLAYAMRAMFRRDRTTHDGDWHFYRVRLWHGMPIASRKVFWLPASGLEFRLVKRLTMFELDPWDVIVECRKIDQLRDDAEGVIGMIRRIRMDSAA